MVLGALLILVGRGGRGGNKSIRQSHSIAVNGSNSGVITNTNVGPGPQKEDSERRLIIIGTVVHLAGLGLAIWEIYQKHFAGK